MKFKKFMSVALSAVLVSGSVGLAASAKDDTSAETTPAEKTYNYVALGDSISSGYGLGEDSLATDPALILTEALLADPVKEAYPAVFGTYLEELGKEKGYVTKATNLSATAYRAEDVEKTILEEGYKGEVATWIFEAFLGEGASAPLSEYHGIYNQYLSEADLVSVLLGGNDIVMSIIVPMSTSDNPILVASATSMALILFGTKPEIAVGAGVQVLSQHREEITEETLTEAAEFFRSIGENREQYVETSAQNVKKVVEAVKTTNPTTDVAILGMFNPYGNSLIYDDQLYDLSTVMERIYTRAVEEVLGEDFKFDPDDERWKDFDPSTFDWKSFFPEDFDWEQFDPETFDWSTLLPEDFDWSKFDPETFDWSAYVPEDFDWNNFDPAAFDWKGFLKNVMELVPEEELEEATKQFSDYVDSLKALIAENRQNIEEGREKLKALLAIISDEVSYPLQYMIAGRSVDPQMLSLNEKLQQIAEETGSVYVDIYNISNENNLDPHPTAKGHREIADFMWANLKDLAASRMVAETKPAEESPEPIEEPIDKPSEEPIAPPDEEPSVIPSETPDNTSNIPATGDTAYPAVAVMLTLACVSLLGIAVTAKRKKDVR